MLFMGGKDPGGPPASRGKDPEFPEMGHPVWKLSFPTHPVTSSRYPVSRVNTPPKALSVLL